ncbi:sulfatase-like hydrolase/transferase [Thalassotalea fonticola]|uniref:Sulfatase-like hydrolase/transferase n=1 Tax=Thalassotalea fonticola TaxID=3065649 RepID=A0ABZ0GSF5_9GAMM|nr:sulfatase-like hydrolase/transferase [Colwelliaceae bacterium S1-1]
MLNNNLLNRTKHFAIYLLIFLLSACNGGSSGEAEPKLTPNNVPSAPNIAMNRATQGELFRASLSATDADNDSLSFTKISGPNWLSVDGGNLLGTPTADDVGLSSVVIEVSDGKDTTQASISITVVAVITDERPNVIVFYADDMGWGDVGYHGYDDIRTPNIDELAASGTTFNQGYVAASVCGPSRAGLVTGVHQQRFGYYGNGGVSHVPPSQPMIFEQLKKHDYQTAVVGKWHLGEEAGLPNSRGVDFFYGFHNGSHDYHVSDLVEGGKTSQAPIYRNGNVEPPIQDSKGYLTEMFSHEAANFIDNANTTEPFFVYVAYNAVHAPWQVPQEYLDRLADLQVEDERKFFAGMILALDDGIGEVMDAVERKDATDNTLVFFLSDNGTPRKHGFEKPKEKSRGTTTMSSPGPLNGFKGDSYEGGIRIPFLVSWPGKVPVAEYSDPVINLDIVPTIMARMGVTEPYAGLNFDGVDLFPFITGEESGRPHEVMHWRRGEDYALRQDDWKLTYNDQSGSQRIMLFNLADDPGEWQDLSDAHPEQAQTMQNMFDAWDSALPDNLNGANTNPSNRNYEYSNGYRRSVSEWNAQQ